MVLIKRNNSSIASPQDSVLMLERGELIGIGDSQMEGFKAANYPNSGDAQGFLADKDKWFNQVAGKLGLKATNRAKSGYTIARLTGDSYSQLLAEEKNYIFCAGTNDTRYYPVGTAAQRRQVLRKSQKALQFVCWNLSIPEITKRRPYRSGEVTLASPGGAWNIFQPGLYATGLNPNSAEYSGGAQNNVVGATATATVTGTAVSVAYQARSSGSNVVSFSVTIDGVNMGTFRSTDPNEPVASNTSDANYSACLVFDDLADGQHTVVLTIIQADASLPFVLLGIAGTAGSKNKDNRGGKLYIGNIYNFTPAVIASGYSDIMRGQLNGMIRTVCGLFARMGFNVNFVDTADAWDPNDVSTPTQDNLHITPAAAPRIAKAFVEAIDPGQKFSRFSLASIAIVDSGWKEYEPNLSSGSNPPVLTNKSFNGRYRILGKTCEFAFTMSADSLTKGGSLDDQIRLVLPVTAANNVDVAGSGINNGSLFIPVSEIALYNKNNANVVLVANFASIQPNTNYAALFNLPNNAAPANYTYNTGFLGNLTTGFTSFGKGSYEILY